MRIEGSSALVVGGASGLGAASVRELHARGARVTIADVSAEKGAALASELGLEFVACDVREETQVLEAVERAATRDGGLRIAICCAGTGWAQKVAGSKGPHPLLPFETIIQINLIGTFNVLRLAAAAMIANEPSAGGAAGVSPASRVPGAQSLEDGERGVCVNTASIAAYDGQVGQIAYSASKGGVVGMTLPAARDLAQYGIRVCTIAPGLFDTPLLAALPEEARQKLGAGVPYPPRLGQPGEYAQLAVQIVENRMLNGETIRLDGALRMPPR
jgi:NAD(P)-dependent dehydrogenase (short-subunit alcohol dehydrogenase family)